MEQVWKKEKESDYSSEKFFAQKKQHQQANDVSTKTCFKCSQVGHAPSKCLQNPKAIYIEKKEKSEDLKLKTPKFAPNNSKFYFKRNVSKGQTWLIKK
ncbi:putative transcription factor interactor and regulator CCHC(Zn) family [Helianthus anomalus]